MAIAEKSKLTAGDLTALQAAVVAEFKRRTSPGFGDSLGSLADQLSEKDMGDTRLSLIESSGLSEILTALEILKQGKNDVDTVSIASGKISLSTINDAYNTIDTLKSYEATTSSTTGCAGSCRHRGHQHQLRRTLTDKAGAYQSCHTLTEFRRLQER